MAAGAAPSQVRLSGAGASSAASLAAGAAVSDAAVRSAAGAAVSDAAVRSAAGAAVSAEAAGFFTSEPYRLYALYLPLYQSAALPGAALTPG